MTRRSGGSRKVTGEKVARQASSLLRKSRSPAVKSVAASALAQARGKRK